MLNGKVCWCIAHNIMQTLLLGRSLQGEILGSGLTSGKKKKKLQKAIWQWLLISMNDSLI